MSWSQLERIADHQGMTAAELLDQLLKGLDFEESDAVRLWNNMVVPVTPYKTVWPDGGLNADLKKVKFMIFGDWERLFSKMIPLRGLCESKHFSLRALAAAGKRGKIYKILDGRYDGWTCPKHTGATLEQILHGADPGDWLKRPEGGPAWNDVPRAADLYVRRMVRKSPHTFVWLNRHVTPEIIKDMGGLIDPALTTTLKDWQ